MAEVKLGMKVNFLTVIDDKRIHKDNDYKKGYYLCRCECGNVKPIKDTSIRTGRIRDCGCGSFMLNRFKNQTFGDLQIIDAYRKRFGKNQRVNIVYVCKCKCGNVLELKASYLKTSKKTCCNECAKKNRPHIIKERIRKKYKNDRLRSIYNSMLKRCNDSNSKDYKWYGLRGIQVCSEWLNDKHSFFNWAWENGYKDDLTIDRIDVNENYCPENCRWITMKEQQQNKRNNKVFEFNGKKLTIPEIAKIIGIKKETLYSRIRKNYSPQKAFTPSLFRTRG